MTPVRTNGSRSVSEPTRSCATRQARSATKARRQLESGQDVVGSGRLGGVVGRGRQRSAGAGSVALATASAPSSAARLRRGGGTSASSSATCWGWGRWRRSNLRQLTQGLSVTMMRPSTSTSPSTNYADDAARLLLGHPLPSRVRWTPPWTSSPHCRRLSTPTPRPDRPSGGARSVGRTSACSPGGPGVASRSRGPFPTARAIGCGVRDRCTNRSRSNASGCSCHDRPFRFRSHQRIPTCTPSSPRKPHMSYYC